MRRLIRFSFTALIMCSLFACSSKKGDIITQRIQYDVTIKSPDAELDWWVQNLEGPNRERLLRSVMDAANTGKGEVYDVISNERITVEKIKEISTRTELLTLQRPYAPYESYDSVVKRELQLSDITRLRFLEEWYLNDGSGLITKKVIAVCPLVGSYTEQGELRGYNPLFWLSFVKDFPLAAR